MIRRLQWHSVVAVMAGAAAVRTLVEAAVVAHTMAAAACITADTVAAAFVWRRRALAYAWQPPLSAHQPLIAARRSMPRQRPATFRHALQE